MSTSGDVKKMSESELVRFENLEGVDDKKGMPERRLLEVLRMLFEQNAEGLGPRDMQMLYESPRARMMTIAAVRTFRLRHFLIGNVEEMAKFCRYNQINIADAPSGKQFMLITWNDTRFVLPTFSMKLEFYTEELNAAFPWLDWVDEVQGPHLLVETSEENPSVRLIFAGLGIGRHTHVIRTTARPAVYRPWLDVRAYKAVLSEFGVAFDDRDFYTTATINPRWPILPYADMP